MEIRCTDVFTGKPVCLTGTLTTDHSCSSYGQPVMLIEEWGDELMDAQSWGMSGAEVTEFDDAEEEADFAKWHKLIDAMLRRAKHE